MNQALRKREETEDIYRRNIDAVYRVCMLFFKGSRADAEDAAQSTFLKLMKSPVRFENAAHEKSWLIVVASNICRDSLRSGWKTRVQLDEESLQGIPAEESSGDLLRQVIRGLYLWGDSRGNGQEQGERVGVPAQRTEAFA